MNEVLAAVTAGAALFGYLILLERRMTRVEGKIDLILKLLGDESD